MNCTQCEAPLNGRQTTFCSKPCAIKGNTVNRRESGRLAGRKRNVAKEREWGLRSKRRAQANGTHVDSRRCKRCQAQMVWPTSRWCEPCRQVRLKHKRAKARLAAAAHDHRTGRRWVCGTCRTCGVTFTVLSVGTLALPYCSGCNARRHKKARVISKSARLRIYERDNWTCQICGDKVNHGAHYLDLDAPTIDHVMPLTLGGDHSPANWQTAHRWCNSVKGGNLEAA